LQMASGGYSESSVSSHAVVALRYWSDLSIDQVAAMLDC
jgi:hypothetical protein